MKLTDTQLVILSAAAAREDLSVLPVPESIKIAGAALIKVLDGLRRKGLVAGHPAEMGQATWRETESGERLALGITDEGLAAISATEPAPRATKSDPATGAGAGVDPQRHPKVARRLRHRADAAIEPGRSGQARKRKTKAEAVLALLRLKNGATLSQLMAATGWQAHSVRGFLSGTVKTRMGLALASRKPEKGERRYGIGGGKGRP